MPDSNNQVSETAGEAAANATENEGEQEQQQQQQGFSFASMTKTLLVRCMIIYFITSFLRPSSGPKQNPEAPQHRPASNIMMNGTAMDFYAYVSENKRFSNFDDMESLIWKKEDLIYGDWYGGPDGDGTYKKSTSVVASDRLQNNGSLYLHIYIVESGRSPNPRSSDYDVSTTIYRMRQLNKFKKLRYTKTHNLLTGETAADPEVVKKAEIMQEEIVSHWHPNLTINIVNDFTPWTPGHLPVPMDEYIEFSKTFEFYKPILYMNDYWNLLREYQPINTSTPVLNLTLTYQPLSLWKWQLYSAQTMRSKWSTSFLTGDETDEDQDSLKEALLETSPYLLGLTVVISIVHSVFEFLAFKNDIQFWNSRQSLEGLSVRSVFFNVVQSVIVLLYVFDNETNIMVKISCFIGLFIEFWKINKVVDIKFELLYGFLPYPVFTDKGSYVESSTKQYDQLAFRYLSWLLFPLMGGYSVYSLLYLEHKGFYSWILGMLYGFLLTFGFIMMTPQLFINYKMKSVAHLPWRMLTYKFLNTFIDDVFAFVIKMPTMYRIGCFRDDIVFIIFLYQRYVYGVDPSRMNEFGFSKEMEEEAKQKVVVKNGEVAKTEEEKKKD